MVLRVEFQHVLCFIWGFDIIIYFYILSLLLYFCLWLEWIESVTAYVVCVIDATNWGNVDKPYHMSSRDLIFAKLTGAVDEFQLECNLRDKRHTSELLDLPTGYDPVHRHIVPLYVFSLAFPLLRPLRSTDNCIDASEWWVNVTHCLPMHTLFIYYS